MTPWTPAPPAPPPPVRVGLGHSNAVVTIGMLVFLGLLVGVAGGVGTFQPHRRLGWYARPWSGG